MADFLLTEFEAELRRELEDTDGTQWSDAELLDYINDACRFTLSEIDRQNKLATIPEQNSKTRLDYENFSYLNEIDLPTDFFKQITAKKSGFDKPIRFVDLDKIDDSSTTQDRAFFRGVRVGAPVPNSANTGIDELDTRGDYSHTANQVYTITLNSATTFSWTGVSSGGPTTITGDWQTLENGVQIKFASTSGYTAGDVWTFTAYADQIINRLQLNFNPTANIELWYVRRVEHFVTVAGAIPTTKYLPFYRYYDVLKAFVIIKARNRNEERITPDMKIYAPVIRMISNVASDIIEDDSPAIEPYNVSVDML